MSGEVSIRTRVNGVIGDAFDQHRTAAAAVLGILRVAVAPVIAQARDTAGGAATENGEAQGGHQVGLVARVNRRSKLAVVAAANAASVMPKMDAPVLAVKAV